MSSVRRNWKSYCRKGYSTRRDCATPTGSAGPRTARTRMPLPPRKPAPAGKRAPVRGEAARRPQDEIGGGHHAGILRVWDRSFLQNLLSGGIPATAFTSRVRDRARETGYSRRNGLSRPPPLKIRKAPLFGDIPKSGFHVPRPPLRRLGNQSMPRPSPVSNHD